MSIKDLHTKEQVFAYWKEVLAESSHDADDRLAYDLTCVVGSPDWHLIYQEGEGDKTLVRVFDLVSSLEVPSSNTVERNATWREVRELLAA